MEHELPPQLKIHRCTRGENAEHRHNAIITSRYSHPHSYYGYYPLSTHKVMGALDYYPNLYARLNNTVITICKFK
jgi:hypothetical protein